MIITVTGNLTADPELKRVDSLGKDVANFTVVDSKRRFDKQKQEWVDGDPSFVNCVVWGEQAARAAELLVKGQLVIAVGDFKSRSFEDREGQKRTVWELTVEHVGPSYRLAPKGAAAPSSSGGWDSTSRRAVSDDPWA